MRIKAETDKKEAALAEASMKSIESAARKAYEKDLASSAGQCQRQWGLGQATNHTCSSGNFHIYLVELELTGSH